MDIQDLTRQNQGTAQVNGRAVLAGQRFTDGTPAGNTIVGADFTGENRKQFVMGGAFNLLTPEQFDLLMERTDIISLALEMIAGL